MTSANAMQQKTTITPDEAVYDGLARTMGRRKISQFLEDLARPHVLKDDLAEGCRTMAADTEREHEALEWSNAPIADGADAAR